MSEHCGICGYRLSAGHPGHGIKHAARIADKLCAEIARLDARVRTLESGGVCVRCAWISVEDRLPEDYESVLVWQKHLPDPFVACRVGGRWSAAKEHLEAEGGWNGAVIIDDFRDDEVTHWMPIPAPPGE